MPKATVLKRGQVQNLSCVNDLLLSCNYDANKTHFHKNGFAVGLVLRVRVFGTRKFFWNSENICHSEWLEIGLIFTIIVFINGWY